MTDRLRSTNTKPYFFKSNYLHFFTVHCSFEVPR
jgi:hypothetical protein